MNTLHQIGVTCVCHSNLGLGIKTQKMEADRGQPPSLGKAFPGIKTY